MADILVPFGDDFRPNIPEIINREVADWRDPLTARGTAMQQLLYQRMLRSVSLGDFVRDGILNTSQSPFAITKAGSANLSWTVDPGKAVAQPYMMSTGAVTVTAQPVTTARWDLVVIRSSDSSNASYAPSVDTIEIIKGNSGTSYPVTPARCIALWGLKFPANAANGTGVTVEDLRRYTAPPGGIVRCLIPAHAAGLPVGTQIFDMSANLTKVVGNAGTVIALDGGEYAYFTGSNDSNSGVVNTVGTKSFARTDSPAQRPNALPDSTTDGISITNRDSLLITRPGWYILTVTVFITNPTGQFRRWVEVVNNDAAWRGRSSGGNDEDNWLLTMPVKVEPGAPITLTPQVYQASDGLRSWTRTIRVVRTGNFYI